MHLYTGLFQVVFSTDRLSTTAAIEALLLMVPVLRHARTVFGVIQVHQYVRVSQAMYELNR